MIAYYDPRRRVTTLKLGPDRLRAVFRSAGGCGGAVLSLTLDDAMARLHPARAPFAPATDVTPVLLIAPDPALLPPLDADMRAMSGPELALVFGRPEGVLAAALRHIAINTLVAIGVQPTAFFPYFG